MRLGGERGTTSPSGLSLDGPAHAFHRALANEVVHGGHARLGDAVLATQQAYALSGHMPELLAIYSLLGDPAMKVHSEPAPIRGQRVATPPPSGAQDTHRHEGPVVGKASAQNRKLMTPFSPGRE